MYVIKVTNNDRIIQAGRQVKIKAGWVGDAYVNDRDPILTCSSINQSIYYR
ncbi:hypothetical protein HanPSC8_Chr09g0404371 [Helianthus annuus]|nr:hypothetical protein HanPSC8_Chr09g0404371 [Helianthus annuus]